jgi:catechol 2,3-dioxygenase-like lactoylglutathione lyase family enzyme
MIAWYQTVFGARVQHQNPVMAFLTYDDEHHRFAFIDLAALQPEGGETEKKGLIGIDHVAYTYASIPDLLANYEQLAAQGIRPYWCIHHGITASMYYADPDGNQMEFQVDRFDNSDDANAFMCGPGFAANPVGVEFDPDDWDERLRRGEPLADLLVRRVHEPVSPLRGAIARSDAPVPA